MSRYFPRLFSRASGAGTSDGINGRSHKLGSQSNGGYPLKSYVAHERYEQSNTATTVVAGGYDLDNESQERMVDGPDVVYVLKTVDVQ